MFFRLPIVYGNASANWFHSAGMSMCPSLKGTAVFLLPTGKITYNG